MVLRNGRRWRSVGWPLVLLLVSAAVRAQEVVREVVVRPVGEVPVEESFVLSHVTAGVGSPLAPEDVARDVRTLVGTRHYSYVGTQVEPVAGGVRLVYVVEGRRRLARPVDVVGADRLSRSKIRELSELAPGSFVDDQLVATAAARVQAEYRSRRMFGARVEGQVRPVPGSPAAATVELQVHEGVRYRVPLIRFEGNRVLSDARLRRFSNQSPWWNPTGWFATKRVEEFDLELLRADARRQYADLGYLDAQVSAPQTTVVGRERRIVFDVVEGRRYRIGGFGFAGVTLFPEQTLWGATGLTLGAVASQEAIDSSARAIRDYYAARGYVDTTVRVTVTPDASGRDADLLRLQYQVTEGDLTHVRGILIRGNTRTKDKVIRREITLNPGELFNEVEARRSERRLINLGYFESVRHYDVRTPDGIRRDVVYEVEEKPTGQFLIGAGFSSVDNLIGFMELEQGNFDLFNWPHFTGGGQKARIGIETSARANNLEASFVEPWFLDRRLTLNLDAFVRNRRFNEYDERRTGGSLGLSRHVPWIGRMGLTYTLQQVRLDDVVEGDFYRLEAPDEIYRFTDEDDRYQQGSLRLNWLYQTIDNPMLPTRGTRATAALTHFGEALGGGPNLYEVSLRARHYIPTFYGHVISFFARTDAIDGWSDDDAVPIGNRYFLGGGRNVRGFRHRAIGPKVRSVAAPPDATSYRSVGGQTLLHAGVEYAIPIARFFRVAAFYDIGNVWSEPFEYDLTEYASSVGGGFRLDFPGFPIRLDYAHPLTRDDDISRVQRWVFWVGFD